MHLTAPMENASPAKLLIDPRNYIWAIQQNKVAVRN